MVSFSFFLFVFFLSLAFSLLKNYIKSTCGTVVPRLSLLLKASDCRPQDTCDLLYIFLYIVKPELPHHILNVWEEARCGMRSREELLEAALKASPEPWLLLVASRLLRPHPAAIAPGCQRFVRKIILFS